MMSDDDNHDDDHDGDDDNNDDDYNSFLTFKGILSALSLEAHSRKSSSKKEVSFGPSFSGSNRSSFPIDKI